MNIHLHCHHRPHPEKGSLLASINNMTTYHVLKTSIYNMAIHNMINLAVRLALELDWPGWKMWSQIQHIFMPKLQVACKRLITYLPNLIRCVLVWLLAFVSLPSGTLPKKKSGLGNLTINFMCTGIWILLILNSKTF